ncbi:MAG: DNA-binding protein HU [Candidatus Phytoplasma citri]|nr:MAG: DNA-binding protein HU [Candidatus Phytoplasma aurantifolia]
MSDAMTEIYRGTYFQDRSNLKKPSTKRRNQMTKKELIKKIAVANKTTITATEVFYQTFERAAPCLLHNVFLNN